MRPTMIGCARKVRNRNEKPPKVAPASGLRLLFLSIALAASISIPRAAAAYSVHSVITDPCHEAITQDALYRFREREGQELDYAANRDEQALIRDAPFPRRHGLSDLGAVSLVLGNRDVDLKGNEPDDLDQVAPVHGDPDHQEQHCLRRPSDDGAKGVEAALRACHDHIMDKIDAALDGLDDSGRVDPDVRMTLRVFLEIRGSVDAELPVFYVEMGRALHTLQDSFSHQLRGDEHKRVHTVLNYVEYVEGTLDESEDGPPHSSTLDECKQLDELRQTRKEFATRASTELLAAVLETGLSRKQRRSAAQAVVEKYLELRPQCTEENGWCDAEDAKYVNSGCSVAAGIAPRRGRSGTSPGLWGTFLVALLLAARTKSAGAWRRWIGSCLGVAVLFAAPHVHADETLDQRADLASEPPPEPPREPNSQPAHHAQPAEFDSSL